MRYDFAPVDAHRRIDLSELARRVGVTVRTVHRWRSAGLSEDHADRCAGAIGMTPHELWPEWTDHAVAEVSRLCATCGDSFVLTRSDKRYCSRPCRERSPERMAKKRPQAAAYARDRYWSDPVYREAQREKRRARSEAARRVDAEKQRAYYERTADRQRAARRERYRRQKGAAA